ncbi:hypothetical protein ES705_36571 [subsurface metagenome]
MASAVADTNGLKTPAPTPPDTLRVPPYLTSALLTAKTPRINAKNTD